MKNMISERLNENSALIEEKMHEYLEGGNSLYSKLYDAMRYSAYAGGKRIRPTLTLEFCRMFGGSDEAAIPYACAVEMIHTYSLIHDDLPCMDNDDLRRGKPTNHKKFGEATALLAGDALLTYAFSAAASNTAAGAENNITAVKLIADNAGMNGMVGGQALDMIGGTKPFSFENLILMNRLKTGCLIKTACLLGCIAADVYNDKEKREAAEIYSDNLGLVFQVVDDILDAGTEDGKTTFLTFMSIDEAKKYASGLTVNAKAAISRYNNSGILCSLADALASRNK